MVRPRSVLVCCNAYLPNFIGGAELVAHYQVKALQRRGIKAAVMAAEGEPFAPHYAMRREVYDGVTVYRVQVNAEDFAPDGVSFFHRDLNLRFQEILDQFPADIAHMHNIVGLSIGMIPAAKRRGLRTIVTLHDHWGFCLKNTLINQEDHICSTLGECSGCLPSIRDRANQALPTRMRNDYLAVAFQSVDAFISPSQYLAQAYARAGVPVGRLHTIWNGVDVSRFSRVLKSPRDGRVRFTYLGYFGEHKGILTILDALERLGDPRRWRLQLVGDGHLRPALERRVEEMKLGDSVCFWGKVGHHEIEKVFRETDVQLLPSVWPENQPVSITESMATRTPVIATGLGGTEELVLDGLTGYLIEASNSAQLADRMLQFLNHPELIESFGARAFERIRRCTFDNQVGKILGLYKLN